MIPKILHRVWLGSEPIPKYAHDFFERSKKHFDSSWTFEFWDEDRLDEIKMPDKYRRLIDECPHPVVCSELFRYAILAQEGGVYIDLDIEILKPIEPLFDFGFRSFTSGPCGGFCSFMASQRNNSEFRDVVYRTSERISVDVIRGKNIGVGTIQVYQLLLGEWNMAMLPAIWLACPSDWPERSGAYAIHYQRLKLVEMGYDVPSGQN